MDKSEYWILRSVVHLMSPIDVLGTSEKAIIDWFGGPGPNLARAELVETFHGLFQRGDLVATPTDSRHDPWPERFTPARREVEAGLRREMEFNYALTATGGARWEKESQADWHRYYEITLLRRSRQCFQITGSDRHLMETALQEAAATQPFDVAEVLWEEIQPWPVTYWKKLPTGHRVTYRYEYSYDRGNPRFIDGQPPLPTWYVDPWYVEP